MIQSTKKIKELAADDVITYQLEYFMSKIIWKDKFQKIRQTTNQEK